jgi:serine/threonine protein phosphatase PrpC
MRLVDPYALRLKTSRETIIFAASQRTGEHEVQEDYFLNFNDECFVIADGIGFLPNGDRASQFACETAIWAFKHIRQHRYYWHDKKLFMKRIFRTTNMAIWQKRREKEFAQGIATNLLVLIVGAKQYWVGVAGEVGAWLLHGGSMKKLTPESGARKDSTEHVLGAQRLGLVPHYNTGTLSLGDVMVIASAGCGNYVTPLDLQTSAASVGETVDDATRAVTMLLEAAEVNGSTDNMTAALVKRTQTGPEVPSI